MSARANVDVVYEDNHLLVVNKPARWIVQGAGSDQDSLLLLAKQYLKLKYQKPGNVYLGVVSRLDAPVTGLVVFARTSKAAGRLSRQFREREVEKTYVAIVSGAGLPEHGDWIDWLRKNESRHAMEVCADQAPGAQRARLEFTRLAADAGCHGVRIRLDTGRKHQIRVQFASRGHPVLGDHKYGSRVPFEPGIALHARRVRLNHPVTEAAMEFTAAWPAAWKSFEPLVAGA